MLFVCSYPRSGTTFLAKRCVLDLGYYSTPESHFLHTIIQKIACSKSKTLSKYKYTKILENSFKFKVWGVEIPDFDYLDFDNLQDFYLTLVANYNQTSLADIKIGTVIDHTPENALNITELIKVFTDVKFLFLYRDPRSLYSSIKNLEWGPNSPQFFCSNYYKYMNNMERFIVTDAAVIIYYEDLIENNFATLEKINEKVGFADKNKAKRFELPEYTKSQHKLVSLNSSNKDRINAWKSEITLFESRYIESFLSKRSYERLSRYDLKFYPKRKIEYFKLFQFIIREFYYKVLNKAKRNKMEQKILRTGNEKNLYSDSTER